MFRKDTDHEKRTEVHLGMNTKKVSPTPRGVGISSQKEMIKMQIELEVNTFRELIEDIAVKGKYNSGDTCKNGQVSNYAVLKVEGDYLVAYNADNINIAVIRLRLEEGQLFRSGRTVIDIEKTVKYLKGFTGIVTLEFRDYLTIKNDSSIARVPLVEEHPTPNMISRGEVFHKTLRSMGEGMPTFGKTEYKTEVVISEDEMLSASKSCDVVGLARYKFDYDEDEESLIMSSRKSITDKFDVIIETTMSEGEDATVEFNGQVSKFLKGTVRLYINDDAPVLFVTPTRMLLKAPYIGNR